MESASSESGLILEAEFSLVEEEYFGEDREADNSDNSEDFGSDSESLVEEGDSRATSGVELRDLDVEEVQAVQNFVDSNCGCSKKQGEPCSGYFDRQQYEEARMSMAELEGDQLDLVILSQINAHHFSGRLMGHRAEIQKDNRVKEYTSFAYKNHDICLKTFLFLYGIGKKRFRNLMKHYQLNGVSVRTHGNRRRLPWNAASLADKERAITFIKNFAEANAIPLPGRMPKFYDFNVMLLPTSVSKASVHRDYVGASEALQETRVSSIRVFGYREFCRLWLELAHTLELCHLPCLSG